MTDNEANAIPASGSDTRLGDVKSFCVIGPTATATFGRTWKTTQADAVAHAKKLIKNSSSYENGRPKTQKLFVVQVVEVVEVAGPPITTRVMEADDVPGE